MSRDFERSNHVSALVWHIFKDMQEGSALLCGRCLNLILRTRGGEMTVPPIHPECGRGRTGLFFVIL